MNSDQVKAKSLAKSRGTTLDTAPDGANPDHPFNRSRLFNVALYEAYTPWPVLKEERYKFRGFTPGTRALHSRCASANRHYRLP
jgi:hypothetical protein